MEKIKRKLLADLRTAMKEKNTPAVKAIRNLLAALDNAGAVFVASPTTLPMAGTIAGATEGLGSTEVPRKTLTELDSKAIIIREITELRQAISEVQKYPEKQAQLADLISQMEILSRYLN